MAIVKTIGGDRLGSGQKMKTALHNYERSTHDLGNVWRSTIAPGVLVPFYKKICPKADTWTIELAELIRTMPAIGPLFGQYKLQLDMFEIPIRLYNGILHNNMQKIGMDMKKVKLPKIRLKTSVKSKDFWEVSEETERQISTSSLLRYLGIKGIAGAKGIETSTGIVERDANAVPILAYYDIFKNYYANKQEEYAYYIDNTTEVESKLETGWTQRFSTIVPQNDKVETYKRWNTDCIQVNNTWWDDQVFDAYDTETDSWVRASLDQQACIVMPRMREEDRNLKATWQNFIIRTNYKGEVEKNTMIGIIVRVGSKYIVLSTTNWTYNNLFYINITRNYIETVVKPGPVWKKILDNLTGVNENDGFWYVGTIFDGATNVTSRIELKSFKLDNLDQARVDILRNTALNHTLHIGTENDDEIGYAPYIDLCAQDENTNYTKSKFPMQGLCVKTYQSDYFNNWLSTDWVDGLNGITAITAVDVSNGTLELDALNLKQKVYNLMNRVAVSGGSYEDWQEAVWGEEALRRAESPIYCGGASGIIAFEEVVSTADTNTDTAGDMPLGSLAGKGMLHNVKGGHIEIHISEPSYIMGIVSITPYLDYSQGNDFDMFEIDTLDDIHKPALDGIGFQDLLLERAAWWGTEYDLDNEVFIKHAGGKLPAWMDYMTSWNEVHGEFAEKSKLGYMVLTRDYEMGYGNYKGSVISGSAPLRSIPIIDWTTYINPTKFNYQFADTSLTSQNFWVQIGINAISRRKMSAKIIPNI